eukprot:717718_1
MVLRSVGQCDAKDLRTVLLDHLPWSFFDFNGAGSWKPYRESQPIKSSTIEKAYLENLGRGSVKIGAVTFNFDLWTSKVSVSWRRPKPLRRECSPALEGISAEAGAKLKLSGYTGPTWSYWDQSAFQPHVDPKSIETAYQLFLVGKGPRHIPVARPRGFTPMRNWKLRKVMIDFGLMRQYEAFPNSLQLAHRA